MILNDREMATKALTLKVDITRLLRMELGKSCAVTCPDGKVTVALSQYDCEKNYGKFLQRIHQVIEGHCPKRDENIFIHVSDQAGLFRNIVKIWKSA